LTDSLLPANVWRVRGLFLLAASLIVGGVTSDAFAFDLGRSLQRPLGQAGLPSTTSYAEKTLTWPTGGGTLDFDYYVDSEEGWDFLRVLIDGSQAYSWSGPSRAGHVRRTMAAGTHVVRFEYAKDGSLDRGLDLAAVSAITARDSLGVLRRFMFDDRAGGVQGWSAGGAAGGFTATPLGYERVIRRPVAQAFSGYIPSPTTSRAQRTFNFVGTGPHKVTFDYTVDSEPNYDFLRVYVDGVLNWQISGQVKGKQAIDVTSGTHTIAFEYYKDTSVDVGRDIAIVDNVAAVSGDGPFEVHSFDGRAVGALPYGWSGSGVGGGLVIAQGAPPTDQLETGTPAILPTIDGRVLLDEYVNASIEPLYDLANPRGRNGTLLLRERDDLSSLHVAARAHASSVALGGESGSFTVYFDAARWSTLATLGCGNNGGTPTGEDRKFVVTYSSTSGQPTFTTAQYRGSCQAWIPVASGEEWPATIEVREPEEDRGYVHLEMRVELKPQSDATSAVLNEGRVGFALVHRSITGELGVETFPLVQGGEPVDNDVWSWATLNFGSVYSDGRPLSGVWPSRSYFH